MGRERGKEGDGKEGDGKGRREWKEGERGREGKGEVPFFRPPDLATLFRVRVRVGVSHTTLLRHISSTCSGIPSFILPVIVIRSFNATSGCTLIC